MRHISSLDDGKAQSLVFTFSGELRLDGGLDRPEPDFLKWILVSSKSQPVVRQAFG